MKRFSRSVLPIGVLLFGLVLSAVLSQLVLRAAVQDWRNRSEHRATQKFMTLQSWIEESYSTLSGLVALVENSADVDSGEFLNAVDGLEARTKVNFMPAKALLELGAAGWSTKFTSAAPDADAAYPQPNAPLAKLLQKTLTAAQKTPNEWFLSTPFLSTGSKQFSYVVMVPASRTQIAVVGVLGVQRMAETLLSADGSEGLSLELKVKPQDDSAAGVIKVSTGQDTTIHHSSSQTQSAHANLDLNWQFAATFDGGVDHRLGWSVGGASGLVSVLLALFMVGLQRQGLRTEQKVKDATAELANALQRAEGDALLKSQVSSLLLSLQRVDSYAELGQVFFSGTAALFELGQASLYRSDDAARRLTLCAGYAHQGEVAPLEQIEFGAGLVGQCALEKRVLLVNAPPPDYLSIRSALVTATPKTIVLIPVLSANRLLGVIELACLKSFGDDDQSLLERFLPMIGMSMEILARNESTQRLLNATQEQAAVLEKQRGEIEQLLKEQETIFQNAPHGIIYTGDGVMLRANRRVAEFFRTTADEIVGKPSETIYSSPEDFRRLGALVGPQLAAGKDVHLEWEFIRKDGTPFFAMISGQGIQLAGHARAAVWMFEDISERKETERNLADSRATVVALIESIPDLIFYKDPQGVYLGCNSAFGKLVGKPVAEITGRTDYDLFPHEVAEFFRGKDAEMLSSLMQQANEEWVDYPDGRRVMLDTLKTPFWDGEHKLLGILGISRDITERKQLEQSMKEDEARLRQILENSPAGVSINNEAGVPIFSNRRVAELLGISTQDLGKRNTREFWRNPPDREIFLEQIHRDGKVIDFKADFVRADGSPLTVLLSSMFIDVADGSNLVTWIYDVSDREKTESALRQANAEQTAIFETARVGIALTKDRIFVRCNPYIEQVFGYEPGELLGKSTRVLFPDDAGYAMIGQGMLAAFGRGETYRYEVEYVRKDGSRFMGRVHGSMVDFKDPSRGVVLMGEDITDERAAAAAR